jgi:hypothetical protein
MPLCPQCVEDHLDLHRLKNDNSDSYIKTFEHVRICSVESLKGFLDNLKSQKRDLERIGFSPEALKVQLMKDLEISKGKVIAVVEGVFAEMHKQLESELFQVTGFFNMNENMNDINKRLYELHKALETIQSGGQKALKQMILLNNNRVFTDTAGFLETMRSFERKSISADLRINENTEELNNMAASIKRFLMFSAKNPFGGVLQSTVPVVVNGQVLRTEEFVCTPTPMTLSAVDMRNRKSFQPLPMNLSAVDPRNRNSFQPVIRYPSPGFRVANPQLILRPPRWAEI